MYVNNPIEKRRELSFTIVYIYKTERRSTDGDCSQSDYQTCLAVLMRRSAIQNAQTIIRYQSC